MIQKIYPDADSEALLDSFKANVQSNASSVTIYEALTHPKYKKATWFCFFNIIFGQLTGSNVMNVISTRLF